MLLFYYLPHHLRSCKVIFVICPISAPCLGQHFFLRTRFTVWLSLSSDDLVKKTKLYGKVERNTEKIPENIASGRRHILTSGRYCLKIIFEILFDTTIKLYLCFLLWCCVSLCVVAWCDLGPL